MTSQHDRHGHSGHRHSPPPANFGKAFSIGIGLNLGFVVVEAAFGVFSNSMALLADAGHNLSDVLGLLIAWLAAALSKRPPTSRYTYGLRGSSILAALFNAVFLLLAVGAIGWEAILRLFDPEPVGGITVMAVAGIGIVINGFTAWLFASGRRSNLNIRGADLHMVADAGVSAAVVVAGFAILVTGWLWLDPVTSLAVVAVVFWGTWGLLRDSMKLSMAAVPPGIDPALVREFLGSQAGVAQLHNLHIWPISTTESALTAHLVMPGGYPSDGFLMRVADEVRHRFGIGHVTLQVETDPRTRCELDPDHVV